MSSSGPSLLVVSHKRVWADETSPSGYSTDGGFPVQMRALAELFDSTSICVPVRSESGSGGAPLEGRGVRIVGLRQPPVVGALRPFRFIIWLVSCLPTLVAEVRRADAVHTPIPGDVGTVGIVLAEFFRKPILVRHCGNWERQRTPAEKAWRWYMERFAGGRRVMLATGGGDRPPSGNPELRWIFSTSLTGLEIDALATERTVSNPSAPRLVISSRQVPAKGADVAIEAVSLLRAEFPGITLDVIGDGPALPGLKQQAREALLEDQIRFHGQLNRLQVLKILQESDLFVFPTRSSEGFPKAVVEALACGLPVVCSAVSVLPMLMNQGCGVISRAEPEAVAEAVAGVIRDPDRYHQVSRRAVSVARSYTLERWRDSIAATLSESWPSCQLRSPVSAT